MQGTSTPCASYSMANVAHRLSEARGFAEKYCCNR